jgi:hypothetical protein
MSDWRTHLREALRDGEEDRLSARDRLIMRRVVIGAVSAERDVDVPFSWRSPLAVGVVVALMIVSGVVAGRWMPVSDVEHAAVIQSVPDGGERRQVQFSTPGGTRIIWTIDPKFQLNEAIP